MPLASLAERIPLSPAEAAKERSLPGKVTGKLKRAIDAMIMDGLTRRKAAELAGLSEFSLYIAFKKPHVSAYFKGMLQVLRENERARNIHALIEVRDQDGNQMARVQAVKALEQLADDEDRGPGGATHSSGLTIRIINNVTQQAPSGPVIDVSPTDTTHD